MLLSQPLPHSMSQFLSNPNVVFATRIILLKHLLDHITLTVLPPFTFVQLRERPPFFNKEFSTSLQTMKALFRGSGMGHRSACAYRSPHSHLLTTAPAHTCQAHAL